MSATAATTLVRRLPRATLVVGKGGVGKTTTAAALALESSETVGSTLVLTSDPARALPAVLGQDIGPDPAPVSYAPALSARVLDAASLRERFMQRWGPTIALILDRGTYLDDEDIAPLVDTALPGSDEIFAALELAELLASDASATPARIVIDTAPTGHTLRLLELPATFRALVRLLDTMQGKHRLISRALTRGYRPDDADAFIDEMTRLVTALEDALADPARCAAVMVTTDGLLVQEETRRYLAALETLRVGVVAVIWNATDQPSELATDAEQFVVPALPRAPAGEAGLRLWLRSFAPLAGSARRAGARPGARGRPGPDATATLDDIAGLLRPLTIVAGKGGVGKSTVASALALLSASTQRTLLVSTDPAPSLADALGQPIADEDTPVAGGTGKLFARQMDASAAFARLRERYRDRIDALFDGLVGHGMDLSQDRAIMRDLLALAPPGVDEVHALSLLAEALFENRYERVIVDPAPTGHLLRLLEMPQTALAWSHQLMRLMLKYREVGGLSEAAGDVLAFARDLRSLDAVLRDHARAGVVLVTLDQEVVAAESARLAAEIASRGMSVTGVVLNRASGTATFRLPHAPIHLGAPVSPDALVGADALRRWSTRWFRITPNIVA